MTVVSLDMAYRSFRGGSGRLRHPPRYAAFNQTSSPRFRLSSRGAEISSCSPRSIATAEVERGGMRGAGYLRFFMMSPARSPLRTLQILYPRLVHVCDVWITVDGNSALIPLLRPGRSLADCSMSRILAAI